MTKSVQFKLKDKGQSLTSYTLGKWIEKYIHLDNIGSGIHTFKK